eukprot:1579667-Alexandrium_andersonii.AAC.1
MEPCSPKILGAGRQNVSTQKMHLRGVCVRVVCVRGCILWVLTLSGAPNILGLQGSVTHSGKRSKSKVAG